MKVKKTVFQNEKIFLIKYFNILIFRRVSATNLCIMSVIEHIKFLLYSMDRIKMLYSSHTIENFRPFRLSSHQTLNTNMNT